jgi:hypothetical protein
VVGNGFGDDFFNTVLDTAKIPLADFLESNLRPPDIPPAPAQADLDIRPSPPMNFPDTQNYAPQFFAPPQFDMGPMQFDMGGFGLPQMNFDLDWGKDYFANLQGDINAGLQQEKAKALQKQGGQGTTGPVSGAAPPPTSPGEIEAYIRQAAAARGINPQIAVQVAHAEGGVDEPARAGDPSRGGSYGPFQLNYLPGSVGSRFTEATGLHASDPRAWKAGIDFALNEASQRGWGQWFGAARVGITGFTGIGVNPIVGRTSNASPTPDERMLESNPTRASSSTGTSGIGPTGSYNVGFGYGQAYDPPIRGDSGRMLTHHQGVDLVVSGAANSGRGTPVLAFASGRVTSVSRAGVAGNYVVVTDPNGREHWYMHLDGATAKIGQEIGRGQPLGILGGTGTEEWPHLHYEVRVNGQHVDPSPWLGQ